ncbi:MAG: AAA family ATPase, partial [Nitrosotalea sp.]
MLQSVELENFLSHKNTKLTFDKGVTVFVGQNG